MNKAKNSFRLSYKYFQLRRLFNVCFLLILVSIVIGAVIYMKVYWPLAAMLFIIFRLYLELRLSSVVISHNVLYIKTLTKSHFIKDFNRVEIMQTMFNYNCLKIDRRKKYYFMRRRDNSNDYIEKNIAIRKKNSRQ